MTELLEKLSSGLLKILDLFKKPELIKPVDEGVEVAVEIHAASDTKKLDEKEDFPETLGELLDHLDFTFNAYNMRSFGTSWLDADSRNGLKKLGAHVPNPWQHIWYADVSELKVNVSKGMPAIIFISTPHKKQKTRVAPSYCFAIKHSKLPWHVEQKKGVPYQFGMAYADNKLFWQCSWLVVKSDGSFDFCKEHIHKPVNIIHKGHHKGVYMKPVFKETTMIEDYNEEKRNGEEIMKNAFKASFDWWVNRDERWSVAVRKGNERVTFCVDKSLTKKYFADRDKTAVTLTGQKKKIIHYVKAHERNYEDGKKSVVKEHIRGVNTFDWKAYRCVVSAPEFGMTLTSSFNLASVSNSDEKFTEKLIPFSKVGTYLASFEERNAQR
jgi:hypothetical protein